MDSIGSAIVEFILYALFLVPGALIRWVFLHKNKTFGQILKEDPYTNGFVGLFVFIFLLTLILLLKQLW